jgi:SAM-dependent methyltransferase
MTKSRADRDTLLFYEREAASYAQSTLTMSMEPWLSEFVQTLPPEATVLDAGCGSGRDLAAFRRYRVNAVGLDISSALAHIARRFSNAPVVVGDLCSLPLRDGSFQAYWASASLLHLSRDDAGIALTEAHRILRPGSVLFLSVKAGEGESADSSGRWFTYYHLHDIEKRVRAAGFRIRSASMATGDSFGVGDSEWIRCTATRI